MTALSTTMAESGLMSVAMVTAADAFTSDASTTLLKGDVLHNHKISFIMSSLKINQL